MKIERIDEKTIKCYISNEELEEYDITFKDFLTRSQKARNIMEEIIAQAGEEVGYEPPQFAMDLQITMLSDGGMVITFSERGPEDLQHAAAFLEYLKEMKRVLEKKIQDAREKEKKEMSEENRKDSTNAGQKKRDEEKSQLAIFSFDSLGQVCDFAGALFSNLRVKSALYRMEDRYYLILEKGAAAYSRFSRVCIQALEFGQLSGATQKDQIFLLEHGECLIEEKALNRLQKL